MSYPIAALFVCLPDCPTCDGTGTVCAEHPDRPWSGTSTRPDACDHDGGIPCQPLNRLGNYRQHLPGRIDEQNPGPFRFDEDGKPYTWAFTCSEHGHVAVAAEIPFSEENARAVHAAGCGVRTANQPFPLLTTRRFEG